MSKQSKSPFTLQWRPYTWRFRQPLVVSGHVWALREGLILRLIHESGAVGYGEVAPVPWFPVETLEGSISRLSCFKGDLSQWPDSQYPCTTFAMICASGWFSGLKTHSKPLPVSRLLPAGVTALKQVGLLLDQGFSTLKWKIGVYAMAEEWRWVEKLAQAIQGRGVLRLDANGGLDPKTFEAWCRFLKGFPIDFIEQPMPLGCEHTTMSISRAQALPVAFDESVCTLDALECLSAQFPDAVYSIKPSQAGDPRRLLAWAKAHPEIRRVYSSAFETDIGLQPILALASVDESPLEPLGLGGLASSPEAGFGPRCVSDPYLSAFSNDKFDALWSQL